MDMELLAWNSARYAAATAAKCGVVLPGVTPPSDEEFAALVAAPGVYYKAPIPSFEVTEEDRAMAASYLFAHAQERGKSDKDGKADEVAAWFAAYRHWTRPRSAVSDAAAYSPEARRGTADAAAEFVRRLGLGAARSGLPAHVPKVRVGGRLAAAAAPIAMTVAPPAPPTLSFRDFREGLALMEKGLNVDQIEALSALGKSSAEIEALAAIFLK